jgi:hypothetical protein
MVVLLTIFTVNSGLWSAIVALAVAITVSVTLCLSGLLSNVVSITACRSALARHDFWRDLLRFELNIL